MGDQGFSWPYSLRGKLHILEPLSYMFKADNILSGLGLTGKTIYFPKTDNRQKMPNIRVQSSPDHFRNCKVQDRRRVSTA